MNGPLNLDLATDQRIDIPVLGLLHEIGGKGLKRVLDRTGLTVFVMAVVCGAGLGFFIGRRFGNAVRDIIQHIQPGYAVLLQEIDRVTIVLAKQGHKEVARLNDLFARGLHMGRRPLQHPVKGQSLLGVNLAGILRQRLQILFEKFLKVGLEFFDVSAALPHNLGHRLIEQQGVQHMFQTEKLVSAPPRLVNRQTNRDFQFPTNSHGKGSPPLARLLPYCTLREIHVSWLNCQRGRLSLLPPHRYRRRPRQFPDDGRGA